MRVVVAIAFLFCSLATIPANLSLCIDCEGYGVVQRLFIASFPIVIIESKEIS
jgi:hypothetical protein